MFRFFYICQHQLPDHSFEITEKTIKVQNNGTDIDTLIKGASVLEIKEVRVLQYTPRPEVEQLTYDEPNDIYDNPDVGKGYYDTGFHYYQNYENFFSSGQIKSEPIPKEFCEPYLKNLIKWLVEPPLVYEVIAVVRYDKVVVRYKTVEDCEVCQGRGWFVDILGERNHFEIDKGPIKVIQRILKDFLTVLSTSALDPDYGKLIKQTISKAYPDDEILFEDIRLIVSEVEQNYYQRQILEYDQLAPDERLIALNIERLTRNTQDKRMIQMDIKITTEEESRLFRLGI